MLLKHIKIKILNLEKLLILQLSLNFFQSCTWCCIHTNRCQCTCLVHLSVSSYTQNQFLFILNTVKINLFCLLSTAPFCFSPPQRSMWVSFFFWVLITAVVVIQRRQSSRLKVWGNDEWSRAETEPFLHRPSHPR